MHYLIAPKAETGKLPIGCHLVAGGESISFEESWSFGDPLIALGDPAVALLDLALEFGNRLFQGIDAAMQFVGQRCHGLDHRLEQGIRGGDRKSTRLNSSHRT